MSSGRGRGDRRRCWLACVAVLGSVYGAGAALAAGPIDEPTLATPGERHRRVDVLRRASAAERGRAWAAAKRQGWVPRGKTARGQFELMAIRDGRVYVLATTNVNAAISTAADRIRQVPPYNLSGLGQTIGIWDGGAVRLTHQEFGGRVTIRDGATPADHATHVGGTIGAVGVNRSALGMAPGVLIDSYEWNDDLAEMTARAMASPGEAGRIQVSSHSYGFIVGWYGTRWYGNWPEREAEGFGIYDSSAADIDRLCHDAPYFLPFKSAGNDRNDPVPATGVIFEYYDNGGWQSKAYDPNTDPYADGWDNGGFDTIGHLGNAKNIVTVGAVNDAVSGGVRSPAAATMSGFSCWGPTDDGRVKPDVVANGVSLTSSTASSDTAYGIMSGTSMSTPNASGSAMLLLQYYGELFPGQSMRASTLKALLIHTADDLDNAGPDYRTGWGLINVERAAELLKGHHDAPPARRLVEGVLTVGHPADAYEVSWNGEGAIRATLCWTDPPGTAMSALDDPTLRLVNDLDLRVVGPGGSPVYQPFVLSPASPASPATTGDNIRDNVEQVLVASPVAGQYIIEVTHKGVLADGQQHYSLLVSGSGPGPAGAVLLDRTRYRCADQLTVTVMDGDLRGQGSQLVALSAGGDVESVTCLESPAGSGVFDATVTVEAAGAVSDDGVLQVADGQTVTAVYQDLDDGSGQAVAVQDEAIVDCFGPTISNVAASGVTARKATITFTTGEPARAEVRYGLTCGPFGQSVSEPASATTHEITLTGLSPETMYHFAIEATDLAGNLTSDDNGGSCYSFTTLPQPDYFTQAFGTSGNDIASRTITFVPNGSPDFYIACGAVAGAFPIDPAAATTVNLEDDDHTTVTLTSGQVWLYGVAYSSFHLGSNGFLTFETGDDAYSETLATHFSQPRVSALFDDLNPVEGGRVSWMELPDRAVVTFENVPEWGQPGGNSFQTEMFFDGRVRITWLGLTAEDGLVGLSPGAGLPADYVDSDLSGYGGCTHPVDFDADGDIDMDDTAWLQACLSGPGEQVSSLCENADLDGDGDADGADMWLLRGCLSGAGITPDPECLQ